MINRWKKFKSYLVKNIQAPVGMPLSGGGSNPLMIFLHIGAAIWGFLTRPAVQLSLFVAQGVMAHQKALKLKGKGADVLLQKYGTGGGIPVIYGTRRVGSTVVHMETVNNKELFIVYAIAGHEIDSFDLESIHLDGRTIKDSTIYRQGFIISDGTTRVTSTGGEGTRAANTNFYGSTSTEIANILGGAGGDNPRMVFNLHKGTTSQAADPMMVGCIDRWTTDHKLTGITYIAANYEYDTRGMFTGIPNLTVVVKGKKVYDPRTTATAYSSNAALCLLDYLKDDDYGKGLANSDIDLTSFSTAANDCDVAAATLSHTGVSVGSASTTTDVVRINASSRDIYNKFKIGNKFTISDGSTTYVNNKVLIDKDVSDVVLASNDYEALLILNFEDGAVDTAITSDTTCTFTETQIRFDCNGMLDTEESVLENTKLLLANMRGIFTYSGGKYSVKVEGTESSVVTLDEDDILDSGLELSLENKEAKYNKVEAEFFNAQKRYESDTTYYTGESSDNFLSDDGSEVLETRIQLPFCTNQRIAYNHAKALLKRSRAGKTISFVATPKVLKALVGEVITITNSNLGLSSALYRITNMIIMPDLNIQVTAIEYQTDVYGYVTPPDEEIGVVSDPVDGHRVLAPSGLTFTEKNTSTGESANLTWTDSSYYPSYEFRVIVEDSSGKTRFDKRVEDTICHLEGIAVATGYVAKVSAINAVGIESAQTTLNLNVSVYPVHTVDIAQGSMGGFNFNATKMYYGTGTFNNSNTSVYFDNTGQFSLKDKLSFNGTTLNISGNLTVENTIDAGKITLDGQDLSVLLSASGSGTGGTFITNTKISQFKWVNGVGTTQWGLFIDNTNAQGRLGIGTASNPTSALHIYNTTPHIRLEDADTSEYVRIKGDDGNMVLEVDLAESDANSYLGIDVDNGERARFTSSGLSVTGNATISGDLTVSGTTTSIDTTNLDVKDKNITLNYGSGDTSSNADGAGITIQDAVNSSTDATILWDASNDEFDFSHKINVAGNVSLTGDVTISNAGATLYLTDTDNNPDWQIKNGNGNLRFIDATNSVDVLTLTSSDVTIDAGGDIILDADGADILFKDGGTQFGKIGKGGGSDLIIDASIPDKDIFLMGTDGSDAITALKLDMSDAGTATFNHDIKLADNGQIHFGSDDDANIYHNGSDLYINEADSGRIFIRSSDEVRINKYTGEFMVRAIADGSVYLYHDNTARLQTTSDGATVTGNILLDDADPRLYFQTGSSHYNWKIAAQDSTNKGFEISSGAADGAATNDTYTPRIVIEADTGQVGIGTTSPDFELDVAGNIGMDGKLYHNGDHNTYIGFDSDEIQLRTGGTDRVVINSSGNVGVGTTSPAFSSGSGLEIERSGTATLRLQDSGNKSAEIRMGSDLEFVSINSGSNMVFDATGDIVLDADGGEIVLKDGGTSFGHLKGATSDFIIQSLVQDKDIVFKGDDSGGVVTALTLDMSAGGKAIFRGGAVFNEDSLNSDFRIESDGDANMFFLDASANAIGIGTSSPAQKLHIKDTSNPASPNGSVIIEGQRDGTANLLELRARDNSSTSSALPNGQGGIIRMNGFDGSDFEEMAFIGYQADGAAVADGDAPSRLIFGTTTDGSGLVSEKMRIDNAGNVGIGTSSPSYPLDVKGKVGVGSDGTIRWGNAHDYGKLTWDTGKAIVRGESGKALSLGANATQDTIYINTSQNVGIGTTSPDAILHSYQSAANYAAHFESANANSYGVWIEAGSSANNGYPLLSITDNGGSSQYFRVDSGTGNVGIGSAPTSAKFHVVGDVTVTGNITAYASDERLKNFEGKIENALDKVSQISGYYFKENEKAKELGYDNARLQVGVNAQEILKVLPEVVTEAPINNKYLSVWYEKLVPLLIEAIKELKAEIEELKKDSHPPKGLHDLDGSKDLLEKIKKLEEKYA